MMTRGIQGWWRLAAFVAFVLVASAPAFAAEPLPVSLPALDAATLTAMTGEPRTALVIGNQSYRAPGASLTMTRNDARAVAAVLRHLKFDVIEVYDGTRAEMERALDSFRDRLTGGVGLFYYSGHGQQDDTRDSYLLPTDLKAGPDDADLRTGAISVDFVMDKMVSVGRARLNILILDACRNNPFVKSLRKGAGNKGLGDVRLPSKAAQIRDGVLVAYATQSGHVALEGGEGRRFSIYTENLLKALGTPGVPIETLFHNVKKAVNQATGGQQQPVTADMLYGDFYFLPAAYRAPDPPPREYVQDCPDCPELVKIPTGSFEMGSGEEERKWYVAQGAKEEWAAWEAPRHRVTIGREFLLGRTEVTRGQFAAFVKDSGHATPGGCYWHDGKEWTLDEKRSWRDPGFSQTDQDPVVCVSWEDAQAYVRWLSGKTSKSYRLPSEAEWEYAARAGTTTWRSWGDDKSNTALCAYANGADETAKTQYVNWGGVAGCRDGHVHTAPVASLKANDFKLHDMLGNAHEWVDDCFHDTYSVAPSNGTAWTTGECKTRVLRGGSWGGYPWNFRSARRDGDSPGLRVDNSGFRVARIFF